MEEHMPKYLFHKPCLRVLFVSLKQKKKARFMNLYTIWFVMVYLDRKLQKQYYVGKCTHKNISSFHYTYKYFWSSYYPLVLILLLYRGVEDSSYLLSLAMTSLELSRSLSWRMSSSRLMRTCCLGMVILSTFHFQGYIYDQLWLDKQYDTYISRALMSS